MALVYAAEARAELIEAAAYYELCKTDLGKDFLSETQSAVERLVSAPLRWRKFSGRFRRCRVRRFPYGVVYAVEADGIFVAAFMHLKRRPGYWKKRLRDPKD